MHTQRNRRTPSVATSWLPGLALLVAAPVTLAILSLAAMATATGAAMTLLVPLWWRGHLSAPRDADCIVLRPDQYTRLDTEAPRLPEL